MGNDKISCEDKITIRFAIEEAGRNMRYIDNFFWVISSFYMLGTGYVAIKLFEFRGGNGTVKIISLFMIIAWILFLRYRTNVLKQSEWYEKRINYYENMLRIDIIPHKYWHKTNNINGIKFHRIMLYIAITAIIMWIWLIYYHC